ncbi:hypothetical protein QR680_009800 [Steinernema hermaphroditum]|uniref:glucuronosyltransferase n=1 Tax=Steinernema hermaphroditum TaxID=289476 RepID=A0AA39MAL7_9BILA|nr:hypothetical protein QR680_009800 [Steinernema hermaphroditum]
MSSPILLLLLFLFCADATKVFVYSPRFGASHVPFVGKIADILVEDGMDVTVVLPKMNPNIRTNGTKLAKTITIEPDPRLAEFFRDESYISHTWTNTFANPFSERLLMHHLEAIHKLQCETTLQQKELIEFLKKEKFDLGISEVFDMCGLGLLDELGIEKHVVLQTGMLAENVADVFGVPNVPAVVPVLINGDSNKMTYYGRAINLLKLTLFKSMFDNFKVSLEEVTERVLQRRVDFTQKISEASFVVTNSDSLIDFPRPITERVVNVGGISVPKPKPLDAFWEEVLARRKTTVLMSFGSVALSYTMPSEMKKAVLETFQRFPEVTFIWKYEIDEDEVAKDVPNVVTNKWVPQNDLLANPNLKLFVTHCGMNSILETSTRGVPLLSIPLFGDQMRNAEMVRRLGTARVVDKGALTDADAFEAHIREALENPSYRKNASRLSQMMAKRPRNQRDELVKHIKFAAEFGSLPEYRIPQLSFTQYYMLDIIIPFSLALTAIGALVLYGCAKLLHRLFTAKVKTA